MANNILKTQNEDWGLWGTAKTSGQDAQKLWDECPNWLIDNYRVTPEQARTFLDSRDGRHLADALTYMTFEEIGTKWAKWMRRALLEVRKVA